MNKSIHISPLFRSIIVLFLVSVVGLTGCKPTEKGYKTAYDAALNKREAANADLGVDLPKGALQQVDGPQLKVVDGVEVYTDNQRIKPIEYFEQLPGKYNVAVGAYKMSTNCKAQAQNLRSEGLEAFPAKAMEDKYYTIAGSFNTISEAVAFSQEYQKDKNRAYVGLPSAPVIIYSPR